MAACARRNCREPSGCNAGTRGSASAAEGVVQVSGTLLDVALLVQMCISSGSGDPFVVVASIKQSRNSTAVRILNI